MDVSKKKDLCSEVASAIRKVQKQVLLAKSNSGVQSSGVEDTQLSQDVEYVCGTMEAVFLHELKNSKGVLWRSVKWSQAHVPPEPSFWFFIDPLVSDEIKMLLLALRNSESNVRKCRSWVRLMLAKNLMISFMEDIQRHPGLPASHYGGGALLRDSEQTEIVMGLLRGLAVLPIDYNYSSSRLDSWDPYILQLAGIWEGEVGVADLRGASSPRSITSPAHSSPSMQRVSPPASDFDIEGITIIDSALNRYRSKVSGNSFKDGQLLSRETADQLTPPQLHREGGSGSNSSLNTDSRVRESYGAMLHDYTNQTEQLESNERNLYSGTTLSSAGVFENGNGNEVAPAHKNQDSSGSEGLEYSVALSLNYEIISSDGSLVESQNNQPHLLHKSIMKDHLFKLVTEKGLDSQKYRCAGCQRDIGLIFGPAKLCKFNGQHYCYECHRDDERVIPARVLFNWDFRAHKVCLASCEYLDGMERAPVLNVEEVNKTLYRYIPAMEEAMKLRMQTSFIQNFLVSCKEDNVLKNFKKSLRSSHICDLIHHYSLRELLEVNCGAFNDRLRKVVKAGKKHIRQCPGCSQKGYICEICKSSEVLYPFDLEDTTRCSTCKSVHHKLCYENMGSCPKCARVRRRALATDSS